MTAFFDTARKVLVLILLGAGTFCLVELGLTFHSARQDVTDTATAVVDAVQTSRDDVNSIASDVHSQIPAVEETIKNTNLAVKESQFLILQAGLTARTVRNAANKEYTFLDGLDRRVNNTFDNVDATLVAIQPGFKQVGPSLDRLQELLKQSTVTAASANKLVSDPNIPIIIGNVASGTKSAAGIVQDGKDEADKLVHPPVKKMTFWGGVWLVTQKIHSVLPPIF